MPSFDAAGYWETRLHGNVALETVGFLGLGRLYNQWLYRVRKTIFRRTVRSLNLDLRSSAVLDIGSGSGFYVHLWRELGVSRVTGLDITSAAVEHLKCRFPDTTFYKADIGETLELPGRPSFDVISALDVLFHIVDDARYRRAIANAYSLLRPGGLFLLSDVFAHLEVPSCEHVVFRPLKEIDRVLRESGFQVIGRRPVFVLMSGPVDSPSRFRKLMWGGLQRMVSKSERIGFLAGAALYPLEILLTSIVKESCSTEIMICKRVTPAEAACASRAQEIGPSR